MKQVLVGIFFLLATAIRGFSADVGPLVLAEDEWTKSVRKRSPAPYPPIAKQMHIEGTVLVDVVLNAEGKLGTIEVAKGNAILAASVISSLRSWTFTPFVRDGKPTAVSSRLRFVFKLTE